MKVGRVVGQSFLIGCLFFANMMTPLAADKTLGELKEELAIYKQEYEDNKLKTELDQQEMIEAQNRIDDIYIRTEEISHEIESLNEEILFLDAEIVRNEQEIKDILAFVQVQNGESAYLEYAFGAQEFSDFIYRIAVSEQITTHNDQLIETHKNNIEENKQKQTELNTKKIELKEEQDNLAAEIKKIEASLSSLENEALSIEEMIKAKELEIQVFEDNGCTDDQTLRECQYSILPEDTSFWRPMEKAYISGELGLYGNRSSCGGEVACFHSGMDFSAANGSSGDVPIYSAANGIVVYMTNYSGYACSPKRIYIQHNVDGEIYTTGYLHMYDVYVSVGEYVSKDTIIGTMGGHQAADTCSTGAHLHFEISTGSFSGSTITHYSQRFNPASIMNFPDEVWTYWYDRTTQY